MFYKPSVTIQRGVWSSFELPPMGGEFNPVPTSHHGQARWEREVPSICDQLARARPFPGCQVTPRPSCPGRVKNARL